MHVYVSVSGLEFLIERFLLPPPIPLFSEFVFSAELLSESHDCHIASLVANESQRVCTLTELNDSSALNIAPKTTLKVLREVRKRIGQLRHDNHTQTHISAPKCPKYDNPNDSADFFFLYFILHLWKLIHSRPDRRRRIFQNHRVTWLPSVSMRTFWKKKKNPFCKPFHTKVTCVSQVSLR